MRSLCGDRYVDTHIKPPANWTPTLNAVKRADRYTRYTDTHSKRGQKKPGKKPLTNLIL